MKIAAFLFCFGLLAVYADKIVFNTAVTCGSSFKSPCLFNDTSIWLPPVLPTYNDSVSILSTTRNIFINVVEELYLKNLEMSNVTFHVYDTLHCQFLSYYNSDIHIRGVLDTGAGVAHLTGLALYLRESGKLLNQGALTVNSLLSVQDESVVEGSIVFVDYLSAGMFSNIAVEHHLTIGISGLFVGLFNIPTLWIQPEASVTLYNGVNSPNMIINLHNETYLHLLSSVNVSLIATNGDVSTASIDISGNVFIDTIYLQNGTLTLKKNSELQVKSATVGTLINNGKFITEDINGAVSIQNIDQYTQTSTGTLSTAPEIHIIAQSASIAGAVELRREWDFSKNPSQRLPFFRSTTAIDGKFDKLLTLSKDVGVDYSEHTTLYFVYEKHDNGFTVFGLSHVSSIVVIVFIVVGGVLVIGTGAFMIVKRTKHSKYASI